MSSTTTNTTTTTSTSDVTGDADGATEAATGPSVKIMDGWVEIDTEAWLEARTSGEVEELTELLDRFQEVLVGQTRLPLDAVLLFITARVGDEWGYQDAAVIRTGGRGGSWVELSDDVVIHRYTDPQHGPIAIVSVTNGHLTYQPIAYADTASDSHDWYSDDTIDISCPDGHGWTYRAGELVDSGGSCHTISDIFPGGQLIIPAADADTDYPEAGQPDAGDPQAGPAGPRPARDDVHPGGAARDAQDQPPADDTGRIICPTCHRRCTATLPGL